jgi:hypothetical protein
MKKQTMRFRRGHASEACGRKIAQTHNKSQRINRPSVDPLIFDRNLLMSSVSLGPQYSDYL